MNQYRLIIAYDGTKYYGWQAQKDLPAITSILRKTFVKVFKCDAFIRGVSRTDAGVHALGQVVSVKTQLDIPVEKLIFGWSNRLPDDIVIRSGERVELDHSIYDNVIQKTYYYHFFTQRPLPMIKRYGWYTGPVDLEKLQSALQVFVGTHDFASFRSTEDERIDTVRTIDSITLEHYRRFGVYRISVHGKSFLRHMIRRIVGAAIAVASRKELDNSVLVQALSEKNPHQQLFTAPPEGLLLYKVRYKQG